MVQSHPSPIERESDEKREFAAAHVAMAFGALAEGAAHPVAIHFDQNDPQVPIMAPSNARNVTFSDCGNTHRKMSEKAGQEIPIMEEVGMTPSGVVRLIELQEDGYAYVRP